MSERSPLLRRQESESTQTAISSDHDSGDDNTSTRLSSLSGIVITIAVFFLIFLLTFGVSVITSISSSIAADLDVTSSSSWFTSAYLIASTATLPIAGKATQIFTPRSFLLVSVFVQAVGLLFTAFAPTFPLFLVGRSVSGAGGVAITPVAYLLVTELAVQRRWGLLFGLINCGYTAGIAFGAAIGGALEPRIGWRAVFWLEAPVCLMLGIIVFITVPPGSHADDEPEHEKSTVAEKMARIDYFGVVLLVGTFVLFLYTLASTEIHATPIALSVASLALFCFVEAKWAVDPIVPMHILGSRSMLFSGVAIAGLMCARWGIIFYVPAFGIAVRGLSQSKAGALLIPTNVGFAAGSLIVGLVHIKRSGSFYVANLVCFGIFAIEDFILAHLTTEGVSIWLYSAALFFNGFLAGAVLNYNLAHLLHQTNRKDHAVAIPLNAMFRSLSGCLGSSLNGGVFQRSLQDNLRIGFEEKGIYGKGQLIMQLLSRPKLVQSLSGAEREVAVASYATSVRHVYVLGSIGVVAMMAVQAGAGWSAPGKSEESTDQHKPQASTGEDVERDPAPSRP